MLEWSHPILAQRYNDLVGLMWSKGWHISIVSATRSREEQIDIYNRWVNGNYNAPSVANPYTWNGKHPDGWDLIGSLHMPQADGYSHALDLGWMGCTPKQVEELAWQAGLRLTVPGENWHFQYFLHQQSTPPLLFPSNITTGVEQMTTVYEGDLRPGTDNIYDFPLLPKDGESTGKMICQSRLLIRQRPASGQEKVIQVWCGGEQRPVAVPADGQVAEIGVWRRGFCSVVVERGMVVEARELWLPV